MSTTKETRARQLHMRVSQQELEMWQAVADDLGYNSLSEFVRHAVVRLQREYEQAVRLGLTLEQYDDQPA